MQFWHAIGIRRVIGPLDVHGEHDALATEPVGTLGDKLRIGQCRRVDRDFVGARAKHPVHVVNRPQAAADGERDEHLLGGAAHGVQHDVPLFGRSGDVVEHQLVGALLVVVGRQLGGIADVAPVDELHALRDAPMMHVEARNDPFRKHCPVSFSQRSVSVAALAAACAS